MSRRAWQLLMSPASSKKRGRRSGPIGFREKPFEPDALEAEVQRQLGKSRAADGVLNRAPMTVGRGQITG